MLFSASDDRRIKVYGCNADADAEDELEVTRTISGHSGSVDTISFDTATSMLASGSSDTSAKMWQ